MRPPKFQRRSRANSNTNISLTLLAIASLSIALGGGLYLMKEKAPEPVVKQAPNHQPPQRSILPSKPEATLTYIRELEQREVPIDQKTQALNAQQEKRLKEAEERRKQQEAARLQAQQDEQAAQAAKQEKELAAKSVKAVKTDTAEKAIPVVKNEKAAPQSPTPTVTKEEPKNVKKEPEVTAKPVEQPPVAQGGRFGLQCGTFKNKVNAENMQARLTMAGFNARISSSSEWNRVLIGPIGDRNAANSAKVNARSVADCLVISM